jgi:hypothetical protein
MLAARLPGACKAASGSVSNARALFAAKRQAGTGGLSPAGAGIRHLRINAIVFEFAIFLKMSAELRVLRDEPRGHRVPNLQLLKTLRQKERIALGGR